MHGITLTSRPRDWEIIQQENGYGRVTLEGIYQVHPAAIEVGVETAIPVVRVMREENNQTVIPWTKAESVKVMQGFTGSFRTTIMIPAGGLYRIETSLETKSTMPDVTWLYRGDCALHIGIGNLFVIAGQSNAAGYGRDYISDPPHLCVHLFRNRGEWDLACHPMNESTDAGSLPNEEMGVPGVSPYLSFAKNYYALTGMPVGLVQTAQGGSDMKKWNPESGELYKNMVKKIHAAGMKFAGMVWYQGCNDTEPEPADRYLEHFQEFVTAVRKELGYEIPVFTFQLNRFINGMNPEAWGKVREAQRRAALEIPAVSILPTTNCSLADGIHNSAQANLMLGEKLARQCYQKLNGGEEFEAPSLQYAVLAKTEEQEALKLDGIWMKLAFAHVKRCFLLYSGLGKDSGFLLEDQKGTVEIERIRANREDKNCVYLKLGREPVGETYLSFAWETDPVRQPFVDEVTYLPPVSFYHVKIDL